MKALPRHVALMRGLNVGAANRIGMPVLAELFSRHGAADVRTYIQSGNVVYAAAPKVAAALPRKVSQALEDERGLSVPLVTRTAQELEAVSKNNPFLKAGADLKTLHVVFLADEPAKDAVAKLDPKRSPGDELVVRGRDIYLRLPNGVAKTKITNAWLDSTLKTTSTLRNWNTVLALVELATRG
jgi:uncharacterized protein (DUF1697 family)